MKKLYDVAIVGANTDCGLAVLSRLHKKDFPIGKLNLFFAESKNAIDKAVYSCDCGDKGNDIDCVDERSDKCGNIGGDGRDRESDGCDCGDKCCLKCGTISGNFCFCPHKNVVHFEEETWDLLNLSGENVIKNRVDFAFFCCSEELSKKFAPLFSALGAVVIDSSPAFKNENNVPLVLPSVNPENALINSGIIACPTSFTAIALSVVAPICKKYGAKRLIFSCVGGSEGAEEVLPSGYTGAEQAIIDETRKIFGDDQLRVSASCASLPHFCAVSSSGKGVMINLELEYSVSPDDIIRVLDGSNVSLISSPDLIGVCGKDEVFAGRIRRDYSNQNSFNIWAVADGILRGIALNMVEAALLLI